jgi:single-strand DNA-binding protein
MNKVMLLGRLTKDPELQKVAGDISLCKFGLAVNKRFKKEGQTDADFFNVLV